MKKLIKYFNLKKICAMLTLLSFLLLNINSNLYAITAIPSTNNSFDNLFETDIVNQKFGKVTDFSDLGSNITVINIQDLHCHLQAQQNINNIIKDINSVKQINTILAEGGYENFDLDWITNLKDEKFKEQIINRMFVDGNITGTEYYALINNKENILKGIDNKELHQENLERLSFIIENKNIYSETIKNIKSEIDILNNRYVNKKNKKFSSLLNNYNTGNIPAEKFYKILLRYIGKINENSENYNNVVPIFVESYPNISKYLNISSNSKEINPKLVTSQLQTFILMLKNNIPYSSYNKLLLATDNFSDTVKLADFILKYSKEFNIDISSKFPELNKFFVNLKISKDINPVQLLKEESLLISQIRASLSYDITEYEITFISDFFDYFDKYLNYSLTAYDWQYYKDNYNNFIELYSKYVTVNRIKDIEKDFDNINSYYETNNIRNNVFLSNILESINTEIKSKYNTDRNITKILKDSDNVIVVVAGGFHSDELKDCLIKENINTITITPNIKGNTLNAKAIYEKNVKIQNIISSQALALRMAASATNFEQKTLLVKTALQLYDNEDISKLENLLDDNIKIEKIDSYKYKVSFKDGQNIIIDINSNNDIKQQQVSSLIENCIECIIDVTHSFVPTKGLKSIFVPETYFFLKNLSLQLFKLNIYFSDGVIFNIESSQYKDKPLDGVEPEIYSSFLPEIQRMLLQREQEKITPLGYYGDSQDTENFDGVFNAQEYKYGFRFPSQILFDQYSIPTSDILPDITNADQTRHYLQHFEDHISNFIDVSFIRYHKNTKYLYIIKNSSNIDRLMKIVEDSKEEIKYRLFALMYIKISSDKVIIKEEVENDIKQEIINLVQSKELKINNHFDLRAVLTGIYFVLEEFSFTLMRTRRYALTKTEEDFYGYSSAIYKKISKALLTHKNKDDYMIGNSGMLFAYSSKYLDTNVIAHEIGHNILYQLKFLATDLFSLTIHELFADTVANVFSELAGINVDSMSGDYKLYGLFFDRELSKYMYQEEHNASINFINFYQYVFSNLNFKWFILSETIVKYINLYSNRNKNQMESLSDLMNLVLDNYSSDAPGSLQRFDLKQKKIIGLFELLKELKKKVEDGSVSKDVFINVIKNSKGVPQSENLFSRETLNSKIFRSLLSYETGPNFKISQINKLLSNKDDIDVLIAAFILSNPKSMLNTIQGIRRVIYLTEFESFITENKPEYFDFIINMLDESIENKFEFISNEDNPATYRVLLLVHLLLSVDRIGNSAEDLKLLRKLKTFYRKNILSFTDSVKKQNVDSDLLNKLSEILEEDKGKDIRKLVVKLFYKLGIIEHEKLKYVLSLNGDVSLKQVLFEELFRILPMVLALGNPLIGLPVFALAQLIFIYAHTITHYIHVTRPGTNISAYVYFIQLIDIIFNKNVRNDFINFLKQYKTKQYISYIGKQTLLFSLPYIFAIIFAPALPIIFPVISSITSIIFHYKHNKNNLSSENNVSFADIKTHQETDNQIKNEKEDHDMAIILVATFAINAILAFLSPATPIITIIHFISLIFPINSTLTLLWSFINPKYQKRIFGKEKYESKYFSNIPEENYDYSQGAMDVTIQIPVYTETNKVIFETIKQSIDAVENYKGIQFGAKANVIISDDGLAVLLDGDISKEHIDQLLKTPSENLSEKEYQAVERIRFYREHNISFVARPKENRSGLFKKASNLNHTYRTIDKIKSNSPIDDGTYYEGENLDVYDIILMLDKDSGLHKDILSVSIPKFIKDSSLAYTENVTLPSNINDNYFSKTISAFTSFLYQYIYPTNALTGGLVAFVGHNGFIRKSALSEIGFWPEDRVSEDYYTSTLFSAKGYHGQYLNFKGYEFKEMVSRSFIEEASKMGRYTFGLLELILNKNRAETSAEKKKGLLTDWMKEFLFSKNIKWYQKIHFFIYPLSYVNIISIIPAAIITGVLFSSSTFNLLVVIIGALPLIISLFKIYTKTNIVSEENKKDIVFIFKNIFQDVIIIATMFISFSHVMTTGVIKFFHNPNKADFGATNVDDDKYTLKESTSKIKDILWKNKSVFIYIVPFVLKFFLFPASVFDIHNTIVPFVIVFSFVFSNIFLNPFFINSLKNTILGFFETVKENIKIVYLKKDADQETYPLSIIDTKIKTLQIYITNDYSLLDNTDLVNTGLKIKGKSVWQINETNQLIYYIDGVDFKDIAKTINGSRTLKKRIKKFLNLKNNVDVKIDAVLIVDKDADDLYLEDNMLTSNTNIFTSTFVEILRAFGVVFAQKTMISLIDVSEENLYKALINGAVKKVISQDQFKVLIEKFEQENKNVFEEIVKLRENGIEIYIDSMDKVVDDNFYMRYGISGRIDGDILYDYFSKEEIGIDNIPDNIQMKELEKKIIYSPKPLIVELKTLQKVFSTKNSILDTYNTFDSLLGKIKIKLGLKNIVPNDIKEFAYNINLSELPLLDENKIHLLLESDIFNIFSNLKFDENNIVSIILNDTKISEENKRIFLNIIKQRILTKMKLQEENIETIRDKKLERLLGQLLIIQYTETETKEERRILDDKIFDDINREKEKRKEKEENIYDDIKIYMDKINELYNDAVQEKNIIAVNTIIEIILYAQDRKISVDEGVQIKMIDYKQMLAAA